MANDRNRTGPAADKYRLADLVDLPLIQKMVDAHYRAAGMPMGIIDAQDGSILVGAGWQDICVRFHRASPASRRRCEDSDNYIKGHLAEGEACAYKCANGLWDIGIPIVVAGQHFATMFLGQFFYEGESPDREFFRRQAREFGYATDDYLSALDRVPAFSREKVGYILAYNKALAGFVADLAEHALCEIQTDKELRFANAVLKAQQESSPDGILVVNNEQKMISYNRKFVEIWGIPADIVASQSNEGALQSVRRVLARPDEFLALVQSVYKHPDQTSFDEISLSDGRIFEQYSAPMYGPEGTYYGRLWQFRDITERKKAGESLRESEQKFRILFERSADPAALFDNDVYIDCNDAAVKSIGFAGKEDFIGCSPWDISPERQPDGRSSIEKAKVQVAEALAGGSSRFEWVHRRANGEEFWVDISLTVIPIGGKLIVHVLWRDIDERKRAEEALKVSEKKYRLLYDSMMDAYASVRMDGTIREFNASFTGMLGYTSEELKTISFRDITPEKWHAMENNIIEKQILPRGYSEIYEKEYRRKDGTVFPAELRTFLIRDDEGKPAGMWGIIRDISERKRAEDERLARVQFLENMNRVNRAIQGTNDFEKMMSDLLDTMLSIFGSDRAWLLYPCDPEAASWRVPMERTGPAYPGAYSMGLDIPMDAGISELCRATRAASGAVTFGPGSDQPLAGKIFERVPTQSQIAMALYPKIEKPWVLGMHQCSYPRIWTSEEKNLFQEIGRRLTPVLTSLLIFHNLKESETKYRRIVDTANEGIWIRGEDHTTTFVNTKMAEMIGYRAEEMIGRPAAAFMFDEDASDDLKKMENRRRGVSENFERRFRRKDGHVVWTMASGVPIFDAGQHFRGSFAMFTDITARKRVEEELQKSYGKLQRSFSGIISAITLIVETRDPYTAGHQKRVSLLATAIAGELGLARDQVSNIRVGAALHDIGKIYVPAEILSKPGTLSSIERDIIKVHPQAGYDILKNIDFPWPIAQIALQHQERLNGSGYPGRLSGNAILFEARIVSVADVVEAMTFFRPYRGAVGKEKALVEIVKGKGILYEPDAVDACVRLFREKNFSFGTQAEIKEPVPVG